MMPRPSESDSDITDVLLENKLLFEQLTELKGYERQYLNERNAVASLLQDQHGHLKDEPYQGIVHELLSQFNNKSDEFDRAISRAIEKEGEVITLKAKLNSVQQHARIEQMKLQEQLQEFIDKAKNEKDRQNLSANEQISILIQERDSAVSNEQSLAERVGELMDEIVRLNEEVTRAKQQKLDVTLDSESQNEELLLTKRELSKMRLGEGSTIQTLQLELEKKTKRLEELQQEMVFLQQRTEVQRQELQTGLDSQGTQQVELYQHKAKVKDLKDQLSAVERQIETLKFDNDTLENDNQVLAAKLITQFVNLSEEMHSKEESLSNVQRDYTYKISDLERTVELEMEKHKTTERQLDEKSESFITLMSQLNSIRAQNNKSLRARSDIAAENEKLRSELEEVRYDKQQLLHQATSEDETLQQLLKKQTEQRDAKEKDLRARITELGDKILSLEEEVDNKEGEMTLLKHKLSEEVKSVAASKGALEGTQQKLLNTEKTVGDREKDIMALKETVEDLKCQQNEQVVQYETLDEELRLCREAVLTVEVFNGSEMKILYPTTSLVENINKIRDYVLDNNQLIGNYKRKSDALHGEVKSIAEEYQQIREKLQVADNETSHLSSQLTTTTTHLESSHKEIRTLRENLLKSEKAKRVIDRRIHAVEKALQEMHGVIQQSTNTNDKSKLKTSELYNSLKGVVDDLVNNPNPSNQSVEVELVIEELKDLREEIARIQHEHGLVMNERDQINKKLQHEQNWVDKLRMKEQELTCTLDEKNEQLSSVKHELQLKERLISDKERAFQMKKGALEEEIKTLKIRYKTMMGGETCGHKGLLDEVDAMRAQLEVTKSTVQYKEQELEKEKTKIEELEVKMKSSNTEQLQAEILKLNIANSRLEGQISGQGENDGQNAMEERANLLNVISQHKSEAEEIKRKLFQADLRGETLVTAIEDIKSQYTQDKDRYKKELADFHERVTVQKGDLANALRELDDFQKKYYEAKQLKDHATEDVIRLRERVNQLRDSSNQEGAKIARIEKDIDKKTEALHTLSEKHLALETKTQEQEILISQQQRSISAMEQIKTTLQLKLSDALHSIDKDKERFDSIKQKLKSKVKSCKNLYEKENVALLNKSSILEEETAFLRLHVQKEEAWRKTAETTYSEWMAKNCDLETSMDAMEEECRHQNSTIHTLQCTLQTHKEEIKALKGQLEHTNKTRTYYEKLYRDLEVRNQNILRKSSLHSPRQSLVIRSPSRVTSPVLASTPLQERPSLEEQQAANISPMSLEEEGLILDTPRENPPPPGTQQAPPADGES